MQLSMKFHFIVIPIIMFSILGFSQNKILDNIEMYYDQGNYKKVYKKSQKLLKTEEFKNSPTIKLFHALAEYQLSKTSKKHSVGNAYDSYRQFKQQDLEGLFRLKFDIYIYDIQLGMANNIRYLNNNVSEKEALKTYAIFQELFNNTIPFEEITANTPTQEGSLSSTTNKTVQRDNIISYAKDYIGVPYLYGGNSKKGFDCSGFTQYIMRHHGYNLPRTAQSQGDTYAKIKSGQVTKGDLVFFGSSKKNISHVGIISSEKGTSISMIHASSSKGIMISNIENDSYWTPKIQYYTRVVKD
jgi:peptidoglycan DL-endopeptidase CwlO